MGHKLLLKVVEVRKLLVISSSKYESPFYLKIVTLLNYY